MKIKNKKMLTKVIIASACILIALGIAELLIKIQFDDMQKQVHSRVNSSVSSLEAMTKLSYHIPLMRVHIYRYSFFTNLEHRKNIKYLLETTHDEILFGLNEYRGEWFDLQKQQSTQELSDLVTQYWVWVKKTIEEVDNGANALEAQKVMSQYTPLYVKIEKQIQSMVTKDIAHMASSVNMVETSISNSRLYLQVAIILTFIIFALLLVFLRR